MVESKKAKENKQYAPDFKITLKGKDITADVSADVTRVEYSDYIDGQSDECSVELCNKDKKWFDEWYPNKGDSLQISLGYIDALVDYSKCEIETIEFARFPDEVKIIALSTGISKPVRTRKSRSFDEKSLKDIADEIAGEGGFEVVGEIKDVSIQRATQYQETDVAFLLRMAKTYGHTFKIVGDKLVFASRDNLKEQDPVREIAYEEMLEFSLVDQIKDVAKEAEIRTMDNKKKALQKRTVKAELIKGETPPYKTEVINISHGSPAEGDAKAKAALDKKNDEKTTSDIKVIGDTSLVAGMVVKLTEIGKLTGNYLISDSHHTYDPDEGYTTGINVKRIVKEAAASSKKKSAAKKPSSSGDYKPEVIKVTK